MAITHTRDIIKDHIPFVKPTHVTIQYGTPVYPNELPKEEKRALGRYTQNIIQEMLDHEKGAVKKLPWQKNRPDREVWAIFWYN